MDCSYDPTACQIDSRAGSVGLSRPRHSHEYDMTTVVYAQAVWSVTTRVFTSIRIGRSPPDTRPCRHTSDVTPYPSLSSYPFLSSCVRPRRRIRPCRHARTCCHTPDVTPYPSLLPYPRCHSIPILVVVSVLVVMCPSLSSYPFLSPCPSLSAPFLTTITSFPNTITSFPRRRESSG